MAVDRNGICVRRYDECVPRERRGVDRGGVVNDGHKVRLWGKRRCSGHLRFRRRGRILADVGHNVENDEAEHCQTEEKGDPRPCGILRTVYSLCVLAKWLPTLLAELSSFRRIGLTFWAGHWAPPRNPHVNVANRQTQASGAWGSSSTWLSLLSRQPAVGFREKSVDSRNGCLKCLQTIGEASAACACRTEIRVL